MNDLPGGGGMVREQGMALLKLGKFAEAAQALRRAVEQNPADEGAWRFLGGALASSGDQAGAVGAFERAVALGPGSPKNHYNLAVALQATNRLPEARSHLEQAVALDPAYTQAQAALASLSAHGATAGPGMHGAAPSAPPPPVNPYGAPPAAPPSYGAPSAGNDLAPVGGPSPMGAGSAAGSAYGGGNADSLAPVGGVGGYSPPPAPDGGGGVGVPNLGPSPYATSQAPMPVLGMQYGLDANNSGQQAGAPEAVRGGWNWGAFAFPVFWLFAHKLNNWAWGIFGLNMASRFLGRSAPEAVQGSIGLVVGLVQLGLAIYLGINGNRMGWESRRFDSVEDFKACQRIWAYWVLGWAVVLIIIFIVAFSAIMATIGRMRG